MHLYCFRMFRVLLIEEQTSVEHRKDLSPSIRSLLKLQHVHLRVCVRVCVTTKDKPE